MVDVLVVVVVVVVAVLEEDGERIECGERVNGRETKRERRDVVRDEEREKLVETNRRREKSSVRRVTARGTSVVCREKHALSANCAFTSPRGWGEGMERGKQENDRQRERTADLHRERETERKRGRENTFLLSMFLTTLAAHFSLSHSPSLPLFLSLSLSPLVSLPVFLCLS